MGWLSIQIIQGLVGLKTHRSLVNIFQYSYDALSNGHPRKRVKTYPFTPAE